MSLRDELSLSELIKHLEADCAAVGPAKMRDILERLVIPTEEMQFTLCFRINDMRATWFIKPPSSKS